jgi:hypothetical protein
MGERLDTPEKKRTTLSNIAVGGGVLGTILTLLAVLTAHL